MASDGLGRSYGQAGIYGNATRAPVSIHPPLLTVLDSSSRKHIPNVELRRQRCAPDIFIPLAKGVTNSDGRCPDRLPPLEISEETRRLLIAGSYKVIFRIKEYFESKGQKCFYPWVEITFNLENPAENYHIPLLISPYSFTTYRGSSAC
ncbi:Hydroxyisourate hydrolase [Guyanagaster necrorhizus]|uniref:5-hydroxyisourate hydrolase n=1 Tax=Guyanagaster necrorhizus TaxID=856835 RepID=A0A9P8AMZ1_9AGAR|nr:Hydroxyisourate hydrolase [Guyanagaster necrorhizus MCA 3950]KAG7441753.1 Hydroxyisourate hydrolase [Guyanagaster necrorhizus MCA 3950]